jgi:hypothetical protein
VVTVRLEKQGLIDDSVDISIDLDDAIPTVIEILEPENYEALLKRADEVLPDVLREIKRDGVVPEPKEKGPAGM